jgi:hypothetical protein
VPALFSASDTCWPLPDWVRAYLPIATQPLPLFWLWSTVCVEDPPLELMVNAAVPSG